METTQTMTAVDHHASRFVDHVETHVSIEWLLKNVTTSIDLGHQCTECGGEFGYCGHNAPSGINWEYFVQSKVGTQPEFGPYYNGIVDGMMQSGVLHPICIVWTGKEWMMGNGHHRLAIAILLCSETIPVVFSLDPYEYMMSWATDEHFYGPWCSDNEGGECDC